MALRDEVLVRQNVWWTDPAWESLDPHLRRLQQQPRQLPAELVDSLDLAAPGIHTVRGPRQVGKSTNLKLLVRRALRAGWSPRRVVYLSLDLLQDQPLVELAATVTRARALARPDGPALLLLDEVTAVHNWQMAVKALWDDGSIDRDVVVCTGSSAVDLARGAAERLPGRRGAGVDHLVLPQPFSEFARAVHPAVPAAPRLSLEDVLAPRGRRILEDAAVLRPRLDRALDLYLRFGGLPAAVAEAAAGAREPSDATLRVMADALLREVRRRGASEPATYALLERVLRSLGSRTSWSRMAQEMDVPLDRGRTDHRTLRDYVELLAAAYFLLIVYFWRADAGSNAVSKDKKIYFGDPLLHSVARHHAPGLPDDVPALVENAVGLALYRRYEPVTRQIEGFHSPDDLHVWATSRGGEVDFVCGPRGRLAAVEVKYQTAIDRRTAVGVSRAFPGRPTVIATRAELGWADAYALVPASLLLWALG